MRRCFCFRFSNRTSQRPRTLSRPSIPTHTNGKSAVSAEESSGRAERCEPSSSSSAASSISTLRLCSLEYQRLINSLSFKETQDKINPSDGGEASIQELLRPDTATVEAALVELEPTSLNRLVTEYFQHSEQACRLCLTLQSSAKTARDAYHNLRVALDVPPPFADDGSNRSRSRLSQAQCEAICDEFQKFVHYDDTFDRTQTGIDKLNKLQRQFKQLDSQLRSLQKKAEAEGRRLRQATRGSALCLVVGTLALAASGLAIAAHAAVTLLASSPALLAPCCFNANDSGCDPLAPRRRRLKGQLALAIDAQHGTVIGQHLLTIDMLVKNLQDTMESDVWRVRLVLDGHHGDHHLVELVLDMLRSDQDKFFAYLDELQKHICFCCYAANQSRQLLYDHICGSSSLNTGQQGKMRNDAAESSAVGASDGIT